MKRHDWDDSVRPSECRVCGIRCRTGAGYCPGSSTLLVRAARAGMTPWAYAVHTGGTRDRHVAVFLQAQHDHHFCMGALARRIAALGRVFALMTMLAACAGSLEHVNRIGVGLAVATTACDWGQTRSAAGTGWRTTYEGNPVMGPSPSTSTVDLYMAAVAVSTIALGHVLPDWARPILYGAVTVAETATVIDNLGTTPGLCGVSGGSVR